MKTNKSIIAVTACWELGYKRDQNAFLKLEVITILTKKAAEWFGRK